MIRLHRYVLVILGFGLIAGCSSHLKQPPADAEYGELGELNELLHTAAATTNRVPAQLSDLDRYKGRFPRAYDAVKSGKLVVLWGSPLKGEGDVGKSEAIVAYEKDAPTAGGYVLLSAGTVKKLTAEQFASTPKGKK